MKIMPVCDLPLPLPLDISTTLEEASFGQKDRWGKSTILCQCSDPDLRPDVIMVLKGIPLSVLDLVWSQKRVVCIQEQRTQSNLLELLQIPSVQLNDVLAHLRYISRQESGYLSQLKAADFEPCYKWLIYAFGGEAGSTIAQESTLEVKAQLKWFFSENKAITCIVRMRTVLFDSSAVFFEFPEMSAKGRESFDSTEFACTVDNIHTALRGESTFYICSVESMPTNDSFFWQFIRQRVVQQRSNFSKTSVYGRSLISTTSMHG
jgi:hypothetical protein